MDWSNGMIKFKGERVRKNGVDYIYNLEIPQTYLNITDSFKDKSIIKESK